MNPIFARDLTALFTTRDLGCDAVLLESGQIISGVFENGEFETDQEFGRNVVRGAAMFSTKSDYNISDGDLIIIADKQYRVATQLNDGFGLVKLYLEATN